MEFLVNNRGIPNEATRNVILAKNLKDVLKYTEIFSVDFKKYKIHVHVKVVMIKRINRIMIQTLSILYNDVSKY